MTAMVPRDAWGAVSPERILVFVKSARERRLTIDLLEAGGFAGVVCEDAQRLCDCVGEGAGAALVAEEMLVPAAVAQLTAFLARQPPWSDFPLVVFSSVVAPEAQRLQSAALLGNVTILDRPVHVRTMLAAVQAALRSRRRQYEARRAIESRDTFLAMLGHELRNPLGAISLSLALAEKKNGGTKSRELGIIERQSQHLSRMVDDLLDVARITHGKVVLKPRQLDLTEVARGAFETYRSRAEKQMLTLELVAGTGPVWVQGDRQRLEQVLGNLIANAIKYTPANGRIVLDAGAIDGRAVLRVTDTGVGLAPEAQSQVFEPFAQIDASLDRAQGGLGLGLALARGIVQLHGGTIEAASAGLGKGSTFSVSLPLAQAEEESALGPPSVAPVTGRRKIVVVEDNPDIRELFAEYLQRAGHDVTCATDGPEGLREVMAASPDVAFVDVGLPGFDGLELARQARRAGTRAYLVALTGYGQSDDRAKTAAAGFDEHLVKPVIDDDITRALNRARTARAAAP